MGTGNERAILYITEKGGALAQRLQELYPDAGIMKFDPAKIPALWKEGADLVFIMAAGIVVRTIGPLLRDKRTDPGVVVLDEMGRFAVSLVSGHLGGANKMARDIARFLGGEEVITTASDVTGLPSIDLWARDKRLVIEDWGLLPQIGARFVNNGALRVYTDVPVGLPDEFLRVADPRYADIIITIRRDVYSGPSAPTDGKEACSTGACRVKGQLYLRPRKLVIGIGCNSGTSSDEIENAVQRTLEEHNLAFLSIESVATIDLKGAEPGLAAFAKKHGIEMQTFAARDLNGVRGVSRSEAAFKATGAVAVAEPAALLGAGADALLVPKQKKGNVTVAVSEKKSGVTLHSREALIDAGAGRSRESGVKGKIFMVGTGPGDVKHITPAALDAIRESDVIVGYGTYLDLIRGLVHGKEVISTGMTQEVDRCRKAVELALGGRTVSVVSGGDPGVYAMAGLVLEILKSHCAEGKEHRENSGKENDSRSPRPFAPCPVLVEVIPGISALNACASRLGAPLMHDFACISLSDRLTPWEMIEKRLEAAAAADFVIVLYNPRSKGRFGHINRAREIVLRHRQPETPVGIVKGATREHEAVIVTDLANMHDSDIDMQTTVIIGNSRTFAWNNLMITPRGYEV